MMKPVKTLYYALAATSVCFFAISCQSPADKNKEAQSIIDTISARYVPDRRLGICDIKALTGTGGKLLLKGETTIPDARSAIISTLYNRNKELTDSIIILPDTISTNKYYGLVTLSVVNMRKQPRHGAELVSQALMGTPLRVLKNEDGWLLIRTPDSYLGWAEEASLVALDKRGMDKWKASDRVISIANTGYVYADRDEKEIVSDIVSGCILVSLGEEGGFTMVQLPDGRSGYVRSNNLRDFNKWKASISCTGEGIVTSARTFMGLPYLWGGSSYKGLDCSGFSKTIYFLNGVILQRDASQQALHGLNVDLSGGYKELRPGDLLFFGSKGKAGMKVTHVAIYIGDSEYIHSSGRVMISSLDPAHADYSASREASLLLARRIIDIENDPGIQSINSHPWY
jgi:hypothetical protein